MCQNEALFGYGLMCFPHDNQCVILTEQKNLDSFRLEAFEDNKIDGFLGQLFSEKTRVIAKALALSCKNCDIM